MLSDKLRKKLNEALDDYILDNVNVTRDEIFDVFEKEPAELDNKERSTLQDLSHFVNQDLVHYLDQYRECETFEEFKIAKEKDINRRFLFDLYRIQIGNTTVEEVEERYCSDINKKKGLK